MSLVNMKLEEVQGSIAKASSKDLVEFFNKYSGNKAIKKFPDREAAEGTVAGLVKLLISKASKSEMTIGKETVAKGDKKAKSPKAPSISKRGAGLVVKIREMMSGWDTDNVSMEDVVTECNSTESTVKPLLEQLVKNGWVEMKDEMIFLTPQGETGELPKEGKMTGSTGPRSKFSGKLIYKLGDWAIGGNPRREGTHGHNSFNLITNGMSFEKYKEAGGRNGDLNWDIQKGYVELRDKK